MTMSLATACCAAKPPASTRALTCLIDRIHLSTSSGARWQKQRHNVPNRSYYSEQHRIQPARKQPWCTCSHQLPLLLSRSLFPQQPQYQQMIQCRSMMAGHNKWSKIRHKKGAKDKNRALLFSKASRAIIAASRACNGDVTNLRLQSAISHGKAIRLPKDRIDDAIAKGTSSGSGSDKDLEIIRFDAMMNFDNIKVACIIKALTDNRNRTVQKVRAIIAKCNGELLQTDKLSYIFVQVGLILVEKGSNKDSEAEEEEDEDALYECALDAGAINIEQNDDADDSDENDDGDDDAAAKSTSKNSSYTVTTDEKDLWQVVSSLQDAGYNVTQFEHRYVLHDQDHGYVDDLSPMGIESLETFLDKLDENEDVTNIYHNASSSV